MRFLFKFATWNIGPLSHLNGFHVFPRDIILKTFTFMHYLEIEHYDTLSFAFLVSIILYIDGKHSGVAFSLLFSIYLSPPVAYRQLLP